MTNVLIEDLHPRAQLISGSNKLLCQMEDIDDSFAGVFFVGYHAREGGHDGVLNHTLLGRVVYEIRCNGGAVDEAALNAGIAGHFDVPVLLVTGDHAVCADAAERFNGVVTAPVKKAIDRSSARNLGIDEAQALIRSRAGEAVSSLTERRGGGTLAPYTVTGPITFAVDFKSTSAARMCTVFPQVQRTGPRTIAVSADDYLTAFKQLWGCLIIGMASHQGLL